MLGKCFAYREWEKLRFYPEQYGPGQIREVYNRLPPIFLFYDFFYRRNIVEIRDVLESRQVNGRFHSIEKNLILGRGEPDAFNLIKEFFSSQTNQTLIHVHIPKSAGTSINYMFENFFYGDGHRLPGNDTPTLLKFFFENGIGNVPFLTSSHVPLNLLCSIDKINSYSIVFSLKQDNRKIRNSMRNQIILSLIRGNFFNRPFSYFVDFELVDLLNSYLFPREERLFFPNKFCLGFDPVEFKDVSKINISMSEFKEWVQRDLALDVPRVNKNKTVNISRLLREIDVNI